MRIGIDVGGTNTDAVLMDGLDVLGWRKTPTTPDVGTGIIRVLRDLLGETKVAAADIRAVMIGTTQFTNAIVERRRLVPVAAIRLGLPATRSLPPLTDWPDDLAAAVGRHRYMLRGGNEFDGREMARSTRSACATWPANSSRRTSLRPRSARCSRRSTAEMEQRAAAIVAEEAPGIRLSLSHEIGRIGFLERENATVMNACLVDLAFAVVSSFRRALGELKVEAPFFISQNDGTLMVPEHVEKYPVLTFASGPTNSMRGAALLAGLKEAMVVDIGGTTSDVGMLIRAFRARPRFQSISAGCAPTSACRTCSPSASAAAAWCARTARASARKSVGYELTSKALVFGGDVLTTTDIVVAAGLEDIGERSRVKHLHRDTIETALATIHRMADTAVDRMKTSAEPLPVILVGGGAILLSRDLQSASTVVRPEHPPWPTRSVPQWRRSAAKSTGYSPSKGRRATPCSASPSARHPTGRSPPAPNRIRSRSSTSRTCRSPICRAMPRAFGSRQWAISPCASGPILTFASRLRSLMRMLKSKGPLANISASGALDLTFASRAAAPCVANVKSAPLGGRSRGTSMWQMTRQDLRDLAVGAAFLGTGGGGDPYIGRLMVQAAMDEGKTVTLLDPSEVPDDALVIPTAMMGAPTVLIEKIPSGEEAVASLRRLEEFLGRKAYATMPIECAATIRPCRSSLARSPAFRWSMPTAWGAPFPNCRWKPSACLACPARPWS